MNAFLDFICVITAVIAILLLGFSWGKDYERSKYIQQVSTPIVIQTPTPSIELHPLVKQFMDKEDNNETNHKE